MVSVNDQLNELIRTKGVLVSAGLGTAEVDAKIRALEASRAQQQAREEAAMNSGYDFAVEVEGATEEDIKDRATSEGPFVMPSTPGAFLGEIWKIELDNNMRGKTIPVFKLAWRSTDAREPAARGNLFCEMKDNAEWVLTRSLENLGIPYEVRGNTVMFHDFTRGSPFPAQAVWERATQGKATLKIASFLPIDGQGPQSAM